MEEIWYPIAGCEGRYEVSNLGQIRSIAREVNNNGGIKFLKERILKPTYDQFGYPHVNIRGEGSFYRKRIHRIVAETLIPNPLKKKEVNHIDNDPKNNCVSNLEWVTHYENMLHAKTQRRLNHGEKNPSAKLTEKDVLFIRGATMTDFEIAKKFGISKTYVYYVRTGRAWKYLN
jgi:hypothetical protein